MSILLQQPENKITETWTWDTDTIVSDNGTEQRAELIETPKRMFGMSFVYDTEADLRRDLALMLTMGTPFDVPLWQYQTRLKANAAAAATVISIVAARTDLREGGNAYIFDKDGGEVVTVQTLTSASATLLAGLSRPYSKRASICPVRTMYSAGNPNISRLNPDHAGKAEWSFKEFTFLDPFKHVYNVAALPMFAGLPVLESRPRGTEFAEIVDSGVSSMDFGTVVSLRNRWKFAKQSFARVFKCDRIWNPADWDLWRAFADYARGSCNPFYVPSYRKDFELVTPPTPAGTTLVLQGLSYKNDYFTKAPYKTIAITTAAGVHYATVTSVTNAGGNSGVVFSPALPVGAGWNTDAIVSLLLKCRIADDKVALDHFPLYTELNLNLRTVEA